MSECEYVVAYLDEMIDTVSGALQSEPEAAQRKWLMAPNVGERVTAIIGTEMRGVSPDALARLARWRRRAGLKLMVARMEKGLRTVNQLSESWPVHVGSLVVWAPNVDGGPQIEAPTATEGVVAAEDNQPVAAG